MLTESCAVSRRWLLFGEHSRWTLLGASRSRWPVRTKREVDDRWIPKPVPDVNKMWKNDLTQQVFLLTENLQVVIGELVAPDVFVLSAEVSQTSLRVTIPGGTMASLRHGC